MASSNAATPASALSSPCRSLRAVSTVRRIGVYRLPEFDGTARVQQGVALAIALEQEVRDVAVKDRSNHAQAWVWVALDLLQRRDQRRGCCGEVTALLLHQRDRIVDDRAVRECRA